MTGRQGVLETYLGHCAADIDYINETYVNQEEFDNLYKKTEEMQKDCEGVRVCAQDLQVGKE